MIVNQPPFGQQQQQQQQLELNKQEKYIEYLLYLKTKFFCCC